MTSTVSAAGLMEPPHRYAWTAGCRTPEPIRMPLDGLLKAAEKGGEGRRRKNSYSACPASAGFRGTAGS